MKALQIVKLSAVLLLGVRPALGWANDQPAGQCINFSSELGRIEAATPYAAEVQRMTAEALAGTAAHVLGYVNRLGTDAGFDPGPKQLVLFPTTSGRYVLLIRELPPGLGLHGPF